MSLRISFGFKRKDINLLFMIETTVLGVKVALLAFLPANMGFVDRQWSLNKMPYWNFRVLVFVGTVEVND